MIREIRIRPVLNGYVCNVGCQEVVFDSREKLVLSLSDYLANPTAIEAKFKADALNKPVLEPTAQAERPSPGMMVGMERTPPPPPEIARDLETETARQRRLAGQYETASQAGGNSRLDRR